jgi:hypothetical protein
MHVLDVDQNAMMAFINSVKDEIRPFDLDIIRLYFNPWSTYCWGIVNINGDAIAQLATSYSATEIMAFKKILQVLSNRPPFQSTELDLKLALTSSKTYELTGTKAEALIGQFLADEWLTKQYDLLFNIIYIYIYLCRVHNGKIVLGPRAALELKSYLLEEKLYEDCAFCKNLITSGQVHIIII